MFQIPKRVHLLGSGHPIEQSLAELLLDRGHRVSLSYTSPEILPVVHHRVDGLELTTKRLAEICKDVDTICLNPRALPASELEACKSESNTQFITYSQLFNELFKDTRTLGVLGTHGRRTVASMVAWIFECAGLHPGFMIDGMPNNFDTNVRDRDSATPWMIIDLAEDNPLWPEVKLDYAVVSFLETSAQEHSVTQEPDQLINLQRFLESMEGIKEVFVNLDCIGNRRLVEGLALRPTGYSLKHRSEFYATYEQREQLPMIFPVYRRGEDIGQFELSLPGSYNTINALAAVAVATRYGLGADIIRQALRTYRGVKNYFTLSSGGGVVLIKDFSMDPTGITNVLESANEYLSKENRLVVIFQPDSATLERYAISAYAEALKECDEIILIGEASELLLQALKSQDNGRVQILDVEALDNYLLDQLHSGDKAVFLGTEDLFQHADDTQARLAQHAAETGAPVEQPRMDGPLVEGSNQSKEVTRD